MKNKSHTPPSRCKCDALTDHCRMMGDRPSVGRLGSVGRSSLRRRLTTHGTPRKGDRSHRRSDRSYRICPRHRSLENKKSHSQTLICEWTLSVVIKPGLEPGTYCLEGSC